MKLNTDRMRRAITGLSTMVKGGDLVVGDTVAIIATVTEINEYDHVLIDGRGLESPWNFGDQHLWTWGGKYGSGIDRAPDIRKVGR